MKKISLIVSFLLFGLFANSQKLPFKIINGQCHYNIPDTLIRDVNYAKKIIFISYRFDNNGKVDPKSIYFLNHLSTQEDSIARSILINAPKAHPRLYQKSDFCYLIPILFLNDDGSVTHDIKIPEKINHQDYHRSIATTLGEVYYRDGNYQLAQAYFQKALREPYQYQNAYLHYLMYHCH